MAFDCKKCLHEKVCALWAEHESQDASCFCSDGCDYFTPTLTPPNEPLTLEQLREMDGEPVWVTPLGFWALVISKPGERVQFMSNDGETVWADKEIELVGPVYRRPPEGEEDT